MDQNYDYYGNRPERPFNEKEGGNNPAQNPGFPAADFQPEKPLMQNAAQSVQTDGERQSDRVNEAENAYGAYQNGREAAEGNYRDPRGNMPPEFRGYPQGQPQYPYPPQNAFPPQNANPPQNAYPQRNAPADFDPVQHTATYQDGAFRENQSDSSKSYAYPKNDDFSQTGYYNPAFPNAGYQHNYPPRNGYGEDPRRMQPPAVQQTGNPYELAGRNGFQNPPAPPSEKSRSNKGLIAVIIVLAVLLAGSLAGILVYVLNNSAPEKSAVQTPTDSPFYNIPDFTYPNLNQTDPPVHDESDYSDQTDKNYKGLDLENKPSDASTNNGYKPDYAFNKVSDSIVGVLAYSNDEQLTPSSQGSGIIISEDGYVVTNAHVIGNSRTAYSIKVVDAAGKEYKAGVVGFDVRTDLAVLKLDDAKGMTAAVFGDSDETVVGEDIIIVGNPGGLNYKNSMTKGVVSAIDRDASNKSIVKYIQTDAAINPGNSGGPAVNMYGQVIGVASAKIVDARYEGMGFCIPSATVKDVVDSLMKNGYVEGRVKIGITGIAVSDLEQSTYNLPDGIYISEIEKNGPCDGTELKSEDVITKADGEAITSFSDIYNVLENHKDGDKIKLEYYRYSDDSKGEVEITLRADKN